MNFDQTINQTDSFRTSLITPPVTSDSESTAMSNRHSRRKHDDEYYNKSGSEKDLVKDVVDKPRKETSPDQGSKAYEKKKTREQRPTKVTETFDRVEKTKETRKSEGRVETRHNKLL